MGLDNIYKRLNMTPENGLCNMKDDRWKGRLPRRLEFLINDKLNPDAFFIFDNKPLILFYDSPKNREELFKAIWNFNETPIVIINEADSIEIYNGFSYLENESALDKLADPDQVTDFSYFELVTGKSLGNYQTKLKQQNRVDTLLLKNIRDARKKLIENYQIEPSLANALIGKCIFVRYLIDRGVKIEFDGKSRKWNNDEFCAVLSNKTKLIAFFKYLKVQFNGEAFLQDDNKLHDIPPKAFSVVLKDLLQGTEITSRQRSLFDIYDFSIIPVEFISNVYEFFIGEEKQAEKGAYYTPKFLVDYILSETVEKYFDKNPKEYNCKTLDPSCGSGIFLVEALRRIIEQYLSLNNEKITKKVLTRLAEENIFGIDKDENAINVAIFSIYLALLDYQEPKDIEKFTFPNLQKNGNFHVDDFFDEEAKYNSSLGKIKFDFIIGNPPWKRGASKDELFMQYIKAREQKELNKKDNRPECDISNNEIAQAFLLRTSDFSNKKTKCSLIVTSKTLYNLNAKKFRCYFLHNYYIDKVFELAPVRREVFDKSNDKAIAPAAVIFFKYSHSKNTESNELIHLCLKPNRLFSLFKIFVLQRPDIKKVVQKRLMDNDWLWKALVYGSYLDFNFIRRLKEDYKTIGNVINENSSFLIGQGIMVGGGDKNDVSYLRGHLSLNTRKDVEQFLIKVNPVNKWSQIYVHRPRNKDLFKAPMLLIAEGLNGKYQSVSAISYLDIVFKSSLTTIKVKTKNKLQILQIINGIFNSDLFSYYALLLASSVGIERDQLHDKEKFTSPFIDVPQIAKIVKQIEGISKRAYEEKQKPLNPVVPRLETEKRKLINQLNQEILNDFDLDKHELALVDYAVNITIPLIMKHKGYEHKLFFPIPYRDNLLEKYIKIFLSRFATSFREKHLKAEIWHADNIIGIFFKVISDNSSDTQKIEWLEKKNEKLLIKIASLGVEKITENLFIQKDIRGFERKGFYIIKPNEKKLWHKAIAYLDVDEFMDAILKAGKKAYNG